MSEWNFTAILVGGPGCGKTTLASTYVRKHIASGGVAFAHDPVGQYAKHGCAVYRDAAHWRAVAAALARDRKQGGIFQGGKMPSGASVGGRADEVTELVTEMGKKCNRADAVRVRFLVAYDEGSLLGSSGSTFIGDVDNQMLAIRRHLGVGCIFNIQQPTQLTRRFYEFATDVCVFRTSSDRAAQLDGHLLLERGELARAGVCELPRFQYLHVRLSEGIVKEPLV